MKVPRIVIDTNVFVSALLSKRGASFRLLSLIDAGRYELNLSVPLVLEFESVAKRMSEALILDDGDIDDVLDFIISRSTHKKIHYLWRPVLKDPSDDTVLELAVNAECQYIITFNLSDFKGAERFELSVVTPQVFLKEIGELS